MKTTKKWSKVLLVGMAAVVLSFGLVVMGCDSPPDDDMPPKVTPTIKLTDTGANSFTLTLTDATWQAIDGGGIQQYQMINALSGSNSSGSFTSPSDLGYNFLKTSDTVLHVTVNALGGYTGSITLTLKSDLSSLEHYIYMMYGGEPAVVASDSGSVTITIT